MPTSKTTKLLYITLFLSYTIYTTSELCNPHDKATLLEIKQHFGNPYILTSWTNDSDCCKEWYIVQCDRTTHRINSFELFSNDGVAGEIPPAIGNLPYLTTLILRKQPKLTGSIPKTITKLNRLQELFLDWNSLSGPVPSYLNQLKNLNELDLSFNKFSGSIPPSLSLLPNLYYLRLDRNRLTGSIPESLGQFRFNNISIDLSHNNLSGSIPTSLGRVSEIDLSRNKLSGDATLLFKGNNIGRIDLSRNMLEFNMSKVEFGSNLRYIDLNHNKIYGNIPNSLVDLSQLNFFNVSYNRLCGEIPKGGLLSQFDQYSFFHNRCLCGAPLAPCNSKE